MRTVGEQENSIRTPDGPLAGWPPWPFEPAPEEHTMRRLLGDLTGARVLDLACGSGRYARLAIDLGARTAIGIDNSAEMIKHARRVEAATPLGIDYHLCDAACLPVLGTFEVATAVWLFNHATSPANLAAMFTNIRANLADGGRLLAITISTGYDPWGPSWEPYGLRLVEASPAPWRTRLVMDSLGARLRFSQWDREIYEHAILVAGFESLTWHPIAVPDPVPRSTGDEYWRAFRENPFVAGLECR